MAALLSLPVEEFTALYCRTINAGTEISLKEKSTGDCVLWDSGCGCIVYMARPAQCRAYPFWPSMVTSPVVWKEATADCPGAGRGELRSEAFIRQCCESVEIERCAE
jgi:Fe-S-cluster containining protein